MSQNFVAVEQLVLSLPVDERRVLVDRLLESLAGSQDSDVDTAWLKEAQRRWEGYQQGTLSASPAEDVFKRLEARHR